jgi:hypothetical protein
MGYDRAVASGERPEGDRGPEGDLGVVEPLRPPDGVVRAWWRSVAWFAAQPLLARLFIGLAAIDVVVRGLGVVGPPITLDVRAPLGVLASFLPHDLLILLPAMIVIRRPSAADDTPNVLDGAVFVALAELLAYPSTALASTIAGIGPWAVIAIAIITVQAVGWVLIGRGLAALTLEPTPTVAGWANVAVFGITLGVIASVAGQAIGPGIDIGDQELNRLLTLHNLVGAVAPLALAYAGRAVMRGFEDLRRREVALRLGAIAILLMAGLGLLVNTVTMLATANLGFAQSIAGAGGWGVLYWLATGGAISLLVLAFGLGLADVQPATEEAVTLEPA